MSKQIEERVVSMKFENSDFKNKTSETVSLLDRLKKALRLDGASKGLQNVSSSKALFTSSSVLPLELVLAKIVCTAFICVSYS